MNRLETRRSNTDKIIRDSTDRPASQLSSWIRLPRFVCLQVEPEKSEMWIDETWCALEITAKFSNWRTPRFIFPTLRSTLHNPLLTFLCTHFDTRERMIWTDILSFFWKLSICLFNRSKKSFVNSFVNNEE